MGSSWLPHGHLGRLRLGSGAMGAVCLASLLTIGQAQVLNLRFVDEDTDAGQIGGTVYWDKPALGDAGSDYAVYMATNDCSGSCTKTQLTGGSLPGGDMPGGADVTDFPVATNTATGGKTHIVVYMKAHGSGTESNVAAICIMDNPGLVRTVYFTTTGYTKANNARTALVTGCHASYHTMTVEMVATAKWTGSAVQETTFDDVNEWSTTASWQLSFQTPSTFADVATAINSYVSDAPLPAVFTGTSSDAAYSLGVIQAASVIDNFVPNSPDPDIARYIARSCVKFNVAGAVTVNRAGYVRIQTKTDKQTAVKQMANVYLNTDAVSFVAMGGASGTLTAIAAGSTQSTALCYQVTGADSQPSCLSPYTV